MSTGPAAAQIYILYTCHAGRTLKTFAGLRDRAYAMFAAGDAYAFNADFSDMLLRGLEAPIAKNDKRIDRKLGGITYAKLFKDASRRLIVRGDASQEPDAFGDLGGRDFEMPPPSSANDLTRSLRAVASIVGLVKC